MATPREMCGGKPPVGPRTAGQSANRKQPAGLRATSRPAGPRTASRRSIREPQAAGRPANHKPPGRPANHKPPDRARALGYRHAGRATPASRRQP
ncbi:MAG TPA: hypothetical protein VGP57_05390 [Actinoplanes sp.]|nr:hypothetical protein [Actinoplanes sp.]